MDPPPLPGDGQPPPIDASTPAPVWPFNPAFTFSTLGLAENPFYMNNADMTASVAPTMDPQFMNYQFGQMGYGNLPMTTAVDPSTTFFMQNNAAQPIQQSPLTAARPFGSTPSVLQFAQNSIQAGTATSSEQKANLTTDKPPPPNVEFSKRRYIGLKTYLNGEPTIHRRVIRYGLQIYQQPIQGKTFTEKERRAIVPPPIVRLWLVESRPVEPEMEGMAESLPYLLDDDTFWRDTLVDVTALETAEYVCIADALSPPNDKATTEEASDHLPSGYILANTVPSSVPSPATQSQTTIATPVEPASTSSSSDALPAAESSRNVSIVSKMVPKDETTSADISRRPSSDLRKASAQLSMSVPAESLFAEEPPAKSDETGNTEDAQGSPMDVQSSPVNKPLNDPVAPASLAPLTKSPVSVEAMHRRNLLGNWAVGCRKMYGMGAPDDLGIWFVFNDISIYQPGKYALHFKCFNLNDTQGQRGQDTPPPYVANNTLSTNPAEQKPMQEAVDQMDVNMQAAQGSQGPSDPSSSNESPPSRPAQALPLCTCQSADFTVYGMKGMPSWPQTTELTGHFIR